MNASYSPTDIPIIRWPKVSGPGRLANVLSALGAEQDVPLARYTTWRVGGTADWFLEAANYDDVAVAAGVARSWSISLTVIGAGSNLLISDKGVRGLVVKMNGGLAEITDHGDGTFHVGAGVRLPELARFYRDAGAGGLEWGFGVPGCVGGALFMNAGTKDGEVRELVESVYIVGPDGRPRQISNAECAFSYRTTRFQRTGEIIVGAVFRTSGKPYQPELAKSSLEYRKRTQPLDEPNAGSVFRNPPDDHAARLIESLGLKGRTVGGAQVSTLHANFIVNLGSASAFDIRALMNIVRSEVREKHGVELHSEVRMVGEW